VLTSSVFWALQMVLVGPAVAACGRPMAIAVTQMAISALLALLLAVLMEEIRLPALAAEWPELAYTGLLSGAFCFAMQAVALRYTSAAEAAVMTSAELPFAALAAIVLLGEPVTLPAITGCMLILAAILLVQLRKDMTERVMS